MTLAVTITLDDAKLRKLLIKLPEELPKEINKAAYSYATILSKALRQNALIDPLRPITPDRQSAAMKIVPRKINKNESAVLMPRSLIYLDSMQPHYVALKRGRAINRWAKRNFGSVTVSGKSRVGRGPRGGISEYYYDEEGNRRKSALFVTPHRFVQRTLNRERNKLPNELRTGINKAFKASAY